MTAQLDSQLNVAPDAVRHIHVMGICGTGMAAIAGMFKESGYWVTGSDQNVYPPMSDFLAQAGIDVMQGYVPENLEPRPDLVIVGNVIQAVFPEAQRLAELGIPYLSMPQALGCFFLSGENPKKSLVVAGTHGKTTTSSLLATALYRAGYSPGFLIGGIVEAFGRNYRLGEGEHFVVEGMSTTRPFSIRSPNSSITAPILPFLPPLSLITLISLLILKRSRTPLPVLSA